MKKLTLIVTIMLASALVFSGCGKKGGPEGVAKKFMTALGKGDFSTAKKYATKDTQKLISLIEMMAKGKKGAMSKFDGSTEFDIKNCKVTGDTAVCEVHTTKDGKTKQDKPVSLKKEGGEWKVHMQKNKGKKK